MSDFKTHVTVGSYAAFAITIGTYILHWTSNFAMSILVFFTTVIGSFLPDMDSDSGLPLQIIFSLYAFFAAGITFYFMYNSDLPVAFAVAAPIGAYAVVNYMIQPLFKKMTEHRGIFHSIPAVLICFFATLLIVKSFKITLNEKFVFALALAGGYLSHLITDEIHSISFKRGHLKANQAFGTALDLGLQDKKTGIIAYSILIVLIYFTYPLLIQILRNI